MCLARNLAVDKEWCLLCWPLPVAIIVEIFYNFKQYYVTYTIINFGILVGNVQTLVLAMMLKLAGLCCHMVWFHSYGMTMVCYDDGMVWLHSYHSNVVWDSHSIWYGMVWVWYGMIPLWYGMNMVWHDYSMVWFHSHGMTMVWYGMTPFLPFQYGMGFPFHLVWYGMTPFLPFQYGMGFPFHLVWYSMSIVWYDSTMVWYEYGMVWL